MSYDPTQKALAWVFTIARNVAIDHVRKRRRQPSGGVAPEVRAEPRVEEALVARQELTRLMAGLTKDERALLESRFIQDASFDEIAAGAQTTAMNARQRVSRLLRKLKTGQDS